MRKNIKNLNLETILNLKYTELKKKKQNKSEVYL